MDGIGWNGLEWDGMGWECSLRASAEGLSADKRAHT